MTIATLDSRTAREKWGELLDDSATTDIVITRYGRPKAVLIAYEDFEALQEELDDLRAARRVDALLDEIKKDPSRVVPYDEVRAQLISEGVLDGEG